MAEEKDINEVPEKKGKEKKVKEKKVKEKKIKEKPPKEKKVREKKPKQESSVEDEETIGIITIILGIIGTILVVAIVLAALIKFDIGGLGTEIIGPKIKNIPYLNVILPPMPEEEIEEEEVYSFDTIEEAIEALKNTENLLKEMEKEAENHNEVLENLQNENNRLKVFEESQLQFQKDKDEFDKLIVSKTNPNEFIKWYEKINPENAEKIYKESIIKAVEEEELKKLVNMYQAMKPKAAAPILEEMSKTRLEMVGSILLKLESKQAGDILGAMDSKVASRLTSYMYPDGTQ